LADFNTAIVVAERRGKNDTKDEAEYDDKRMFFLSLMHLLE
jgi:hypothetical protein